jgi:hypothetical protein
MPVRPTVSGNKLVTSRGNNQTHRPECKASSWTSHHGKLKLRERIGPETMESGVA